MSIRAYSIFSRELRQLRSFYDTTLRAYSRVKEIQELADFSEPLKNALHGNGVSWSKSEKRIRTEHRKNKIESILRELILVRAISALETFLTDAIRDVFVVTKSPFMDKSVRIDLSQEELIANNTPTKIYGKIINRETRKLTSGGFNEFIKYYKKRFSIDLSQVSPGYKRMNEYHDIRHILVHRLGQTDEAFRRKYHTDSQQISVDTLLLNSLFDDLETFAVQAEEKIGELIDEYADIDTEYNARYVTDILLLDGDLPNCLHPSYQFWADDEYVMMTDVLLGTSLAKEGRVRYYFNGSDRALRHLKRKLRREHKKLSISVSDVVVAFRFDKKQRLVPEDVISLVRNELPDQPWPKGIHKEIAKKHGLSNAKVSAAIDALIFRGLFRDQVDGKILK
jgi:hypothetical protein